MKLPTEVFGDVVVVHAPEEFSRDRAENFEVFVPSLQQHKVVLDLDHTEILGSTGLEAMLNVCDKLRERGGDLKVAASNPTNRKILEITRLDQQLEVFSNMIDAVRSFR